MRLTKDSRITAPEILTKAKAAGLKLWLTTRNGILGIAYNDATKIKPFVPHIKANRDEIIRLLKIRLPKLTKKGIPGAIALELSRQWLDENQTESSTPIAVPTRVRFLIGWLPPAKQRKFQLNSKGQDDGQLPWKDWNEVYQVVEAEHQSHVAFVDGFRGRILWKSKEESHSKN